MVPPLCKHDRGWAAIHYYCLCWFASVLHNTMHHTWWLPLPQLDETVPYQFFHPTLAP